MKYKIIIEETVAEEFEIDAKNVKTAMELASEKYKKGEIVLSPGNLVCKQMAVLSPEGEITEWVEF